MSQRDDEQLKAGASGFAYTFAKNRKFCGLCLIVKRTLTEQRSSGQDALLKYSKTPEAAPFKAFYDDKIKGNGGILAIYSGEVSEDVKQGFFKLSKQHWENLTSFIKNELPGYLPDSGFIDGNIPGEDDFHVGSWLARITLVCGGQPTKDGYKALEKELGGPVPKKVAAYWEAWIERPGWKQTYAESLR